jgi:uncharacterized membrane protein
MNRTRGLVMLMLATGLAQGCGGPRPDRKAGRLTDVVAQTIETKGVEAAEAQYRSLRAQGFPGVSESEADTNSLGYRLLRKQNPQAAIAVFRLNVETHPTSANVYDSLGEAQLAAGLRADAVLSYRKAVQIAPRKKSARNALQALTGERRSYPPLLLFHIGAATLGLLSGTVAMALRKGSRGHGLVGDVFVVSMLCMSAAAAYLAYTTPDGPVINLLMGVFTFYLVATGWWTAKRREERTGPFDWIALGVVLAAAVGFARQGWGAARTGPTDGIPAGLYFFLGSFAVLAAVSDARLLARGGIAGGRRLGRHLGRMCGAMLIGVSSLFLGQPQVFPAALSSALVRALPSLAVIAFWIYWRRRVSSSTAGRQGAPAPSVVAAPAT